MRYLIQRNGLKVSSADTMIDALEYVFCDAQAPVRQDNEYCTSYGSWESWRFYNNFEYYDVDRFPLGASIDDLYDVADLIESACEAEEIIGADELERFEISRELADKYFNGKSVFLTSSN